MPWYIYPLQFISGLFLANGVPHFVQGISGHWFQSPFASPPGVGESSPLVNVLWGSLNLAVGFALLWAFAPKGSEVVGEWIIVGLGVLLAAFRQRALERRVSDCVGAAFPSFAGEGGRRPDGCGPMLMCGAYRTSMASIFQRIRNGFPHPIRPSATFPAVAEKGISRAHLPREDAPTSARPPLRLSCVSPFASRRASSPRPWSCGAAISCGGGGPSARRCRRRSS
jgi:hypothetical protein